MWCDYKVSNGSNYGKPPWNDAWTQVGITVGVTRVLSIPPASCACSTKQTRWPQSTVLWCRCLCPVCLYDRCRQRCFPMFPPPGQNFETENIKISRICSYHYPTIHSGQVHCLMVHLSGSCQIAKSEKHHARTSCLPRICLRAVISHFVNVWHGVGPRKPLGDCE